MPTVLRAGPYRFFFYAGDRPEPAHIHVERDENRAKFWLDPVRLQDSGGFRAPELGEVSPHSWINIRTSYGAPGMSTSTANPAPPPAATGVSVCDEMLVVELSDGRVLAVPLLWYPRLWHGTTEERAQWRLIGRGEGIHWPELDEDLSVEGLLAGRPSGESQRSLQRWLSARTQRGAA